MRTQPFIHACGAAVTAWRRRLCGRWLAVTLTIIGAIVAPPLAMKGDHTAWAAFTLPPAPWGEFTPFYGAQPCIPDFQDVGIFSPAEAKADALVDTLLKKRLLGEEDVADIRKYDQQDRDRRAARNFYGNLSYRIQTLFNYFEGDSRAKGVDPSINQTSPTTTIPSRNPRVAPSSSGSSTLYGGSQENVYDISVRRLRFQFSGCVYQDMQFHIELSADNLGNVVSRDVDIMWTKYPWMNIAVGQIKMPNSRERQLSSGAIHFPERAFASQGIAAVGREVGVHFSGMDIYDVFDYKVMAATGYGFNRQYEQFDDTSNLVYAGRFTLHPFGRVPFWAGDVWNSWSPLFEFSFTYLYGPKAFAMGEMNAIQSFDLCQAYGLASQATMSPTAGCTRPPTSGASGNPGYTLLPLGRANINPNAIGDWTDVGFDTTFMYRGFYANFEYHNMMYDPNNGNPNLASFPGLRTITYALDTGYFLIPRTWELLFRYSYVDINHGQTSAPGVAYNTSSPDPTVNRKVIDARWYEFGTVVYLSHDHRHKLGVFGHIRDEMGAELHNNGFSVNLQLAF